MKLPMNQRMKSEWVRVAEFDSSDMYKKAVVYQRRADGLFRVECLSCDYLPYDDLDYDLFAFHHYASRERALEVAEEYTLTG